MDAEILTSGFRKRERNSLLNSVIWFLQNYMTYICASLNGYNRAYQTDVKDCLEACTSPLLRKRRKDRILLSLTELHENKNVDPSLKPKIHQLIDVIGEY